MVVVLPAPFTPTNRITEGAGPSSKVPTRPDEAIPQLGRQRPPRVVAAATAGCREPLSSGIDDLHRGSRSEVGSDEELGDVVPGLLVALGPAPRIARSRAPSPDGFARSPMPAAHAPDAPSSAAANGSASSLTPPACTDLDGTSARRSDRTRLTAASVMVTP